MHSSENNIPILVVCNSEHHSKNLIDLAERLTSLDKRISVVALCENSDLDSYSKLIDSNKTRLISIDYAKQLNQNRTLNINKPDLNDAAKLTLKRRLSEVMFSQLMRLNNYLGNNSQLSRILLAVVRESTIGCYLREKRAKAFFLRRSDMVEKIFNDIKPKVVFSFGDRHIDIEAPILMAAHSVGIKVVIPYGTYSGSSGLLRIRQIQGEPKKWLPFSLYRTYAAIRLNSQVMQGYFYQHPSVLFALNSLNCMSSNPWCIGNGVSDIVCVDNTHTAERYQKEGVERSKVRIVGDTAFDTLHHKYECRDKIKEDVINEEKLDASKKIIVLALPQLAEQGILDWDEHWIEIHYLLDRLFKLNLNVLISLHPRVKEENYLFLEEKYPARITKRSLNEILPVADVFIAANSSTVFWAVLCGVPTVVVDYYGLDSSLFNHLKSIRYVKDKETLLDTMQKALDENTDFDDDWKTLSRTEVFDGNTTGRYYDIVLDCLKG